MSSTVSTPWLMKATTRSCADPKSFVREGPTLTMIVFYEGMIYIALKAGHHRVDDSLTMNVGLVACDFPGDADQYC